MPPAYLSNGRLTLRAMVATDADDAMSWFPAPFPASAGQASRWLNEAHRSSVWDDPGTLWLAIVERPKPLTPDDERDGRIVGAVELRHPRSRTSDLALHLAPYLEFDVRDSLQAEVIDLVVPWVRDELEAMVLTLSIGSDQPESVAAAESLGMILAARLREHLARPGGRADLLWYQALNPTGRGANPELPDRTRAAGQGAVQDA